MGLIVPLPADVLGLRLCNYCRWATNLPVETGKPNPGVTKHG